VDEAQMYGIPGSHAARTGELMLQHKGIPYRRKDLEPGFHRIYVRLRGFKGDRVPAVKFADGTRGQGTRPLARVLDEKQPEPRLVPDDPRVEEAEQWGDEVLQQWARRMAAGGGARDPNLLEAKGASGRLGALLVKGSDRRRQFVAKMVLKAFKVSKEQLAEDETRIDEMFDRVDGYIADGVLNGAELNCADFSIATSLALVDYRLDVRPRMQGRPLYGLVERVLPVPGR
jgi:glutathione S-transferase